MRCTVISKGMPLPELQALLKRMGASSVRVAPRSGQVFCDLPQASIQSLKALSGLAVKTPGKVRTQQVYEAYGPMTGTNAALVALLDRVREIRTPPVLGGMWKVAVLDTGILDTHIMLKGKVVYTRNYSSSPVVRDVFDHGTAIAGLIAGGRPVPGEEQGVAPGAQLLNIKVLGDNGIGEEEDVVMGVEDAIDQGAKIINMSFGTEDTGDPDSPVRVACQAAFNAGALVCAAGGNTGPGPGTIMCPACDPTVWGVGALGFDGYVASFSARGPSKEGVVKPDVMFYGDRVLLPSSKGDEVFVTKGGTSFACGGFSGVMALLQEGAARVNGRELTQEESWAMTMRVTKKPPTVLQPPNKDNDYGWGTPFGDMVVRPTGAMTELVTPVMSIGMLGALMSGMVPA